MSAEIALLGRMYEAFNGRELEAMLDCLHPDIEARPLIGSVEGRVYRGHAGIRHWMTRVLPEIWDELEAHPEGHLQGDGVLVVLIRNVGRGAASGARVEQRVAHLVRMQDGKIRELVSYPDRSEALKAAGVEQQDAR